MEDMFELEDDSLGSSKHENFAGVRQVWTPQEDEGGFDADADLQGQRADKTDKALATSVPISIPSFKRKEQKPSEEQRAATTFIPPHQMSQQDPSLLMEGSVPYSSSSRLRNRDLVLRSTGYLPQKHTAGFHTVSRTTSINGTSASGALRSAAGDASLSGQLAARTGQLAGLEEDAHAESERLPGAAELPPANQHSDGSRSGSIAMSRHERRTTAPKLTPAALAPLNTGAGAANGALHQIAQSIREQSVTGSDAS